MKTSVKVGLRETTIIRQRGQLTIPDSFRDRLSWLRPKNVIFLESHADNRITLAPYRSDEEVDWAGLKRKLSRVQAFRGRGGNLSDFIRRDREQR